MRKSCTTGVAVIAWAVPTAVALGAEGSEGPSLFTGDLGNVLWTLLTFVAVLIVLGRFAWGPILRALQKREDFIRESLAQARKEREQAEARLKEYTDKLHQARTEATAIVDEGRRDAQVVRRQIEEDARNEATALIERAKREIGIATDTAVKELYDLSAKIATDVAGRIIRKELNEQEHRRLITESIEELSQRSRN